MEYILKESTKVSEKFLEDILKLDATVYSPELQGDINSLKNRYNKNKDSYLLLYKNEKLIGYICFFPITKELSEDIYTSNVIHDDDITEKDISLYSKDSKTDIYILSIVIEKNHRDGEAVKTLTDGFVNYIQNKINSGYLLGNIIATAVSNDGIKFLNNLNLNEVKEIENGYRVMDCKASNLQNVFVKKDYKNDVYIMMPLSGNMVKNVQNQNIKEDFSYIETIDKLSKYECNNNIVKKIKRTFLGKYKLAYMNDEYDGNILGKIDSYFYLTSHQDTNLNILTIVIPDNKYSATQIQDQVSSNNLYILIDENMVNVEEYIEKNYNLVKCGDTKTVLCLSNKPSNPNELNYMLASESFNSIYNKKYNSNKISSTQIENISSVNIAQYEFYEAYSSRTSIVYIMKSFLNDLEKRLPYEAILLFIVELNIFQISAIKRTNKKIMDGLSKEGNVSLKFIETLYKEFGKTVVFWDYNNFNYSTSQYLANQINESFKTNEELDTYYRNQNFLEHIVDLKDAQLSNKENKILNVIVLILTLLQVIPVIISFLQWLFDKYTDGNLLPIFTTTGSLSAITLILLIVLLQRKNKENRKKNR